LAVSGPHPYGINFIGKNIWDFYNGILGLNACVPEEVIKRVQEKLFSYLWRNKKAKVKRTVVYQRPCRGGLNFPNVRTTVKALRLSWIGRLLGEFDDAWKATPGAYFNRYGRLPFLLKCN